MATNPMYTCRVILPKMEHNFIFYIVGINGFWGHVLIIGKGEACKNACQMRTGRVTRRAM